MITYYAEHGSIVYSVLLDASKAFDRVEFCMMFKKLIMLLFLGYCCLCILIKHYV